MQLQLDRLRVQFQRVEDRYAHSIWLDDDQVLQSLEGDAGQIWPASPPIQQLSLEDQGSATVALGLGMAGISHWSLSVAPQETGFLFDVACRLLGPDPQAGQLGSSYRLNPDWKARSHTAIQSAASGMKIWIEPMDSQLVWASESMFRIDASPATGRWRYGVRVEA